MNFCPSCGGSVRLRIPADDNRPRSVCDSCGTIHYENPRIIVGTLPVWQGRVLLCRRAIEPRSGFWTLPAGFMELGETSPEGAERETLEESGAQVQIGRLFAIIDIPRVQQVHLFYLADMRSPALDPGPESLEARLFDEAEVPWGDLAFRSVEEVLQRYFEDRRSAQQQLHEVCLAPLSSMAPSLSTALP